MALDPNRELIVCSDPEAVAREGARRFALHAAAAIQQHGRLAVALSGGSTPKRMYEVLAQEYRDSIDWDFVHFFWGDERFVPSTNAASNYHMTEVALLNALELQNGNVHRVRTELENADAAAAAYERELISFFSLASGEFPRFELILLGLGTNGHTASLFPYSKTLHETSRLVVADYVEEVKQSRITFTVPTINNARDILFLVTGADKAAVVKEVLFGPTDTERLPAQLIRANSATSTWLLDRAAAGQLPKDSFRILT